jgi:hypothetical protein
VGVCLFVRNCDTKSVTTFFRNSAIIFVWQQYKKVYISTARVSSRYLTDKEKEVILAQVKDFLNNDNWGSALVHILG